MAPPIRDDFQLADTRERIAVYQDLLTRLRHDSLPEEFHLLSRGCRAEIEAMHQQVMEYLGRHAMQPLSPPPAMTGSLAESGRRGERGRG